MARQTTIPPLTAAPSFAVNNEQDEFDFDFPFFAAADIVVRVDGVALSPNDFVVTGHLVQDGDAVEGGYGSGTVTLDTAVANCTVVVDRVVSPVRQTVFPSNVPLQMTALNADVNRQVAALQDLARNTAPLVNGEVPAIYLPVALGAAKADLSNVLGDIYGNGAQQLAGYLDTSRVVTDITIQAPAALYALLDWQPSANVIGVNPDGIYGAIYINDPGTYAGHATAGRFNAYVLIQPSNALINIDLISGVYGRVKQDAAGTLGRAIAVMADDFWKTGTGTCTESVGLMIYGYRGHAATNYGILFDDYAKNGGHIATEGNRTLTIIPGGTGRTQVKNLSLTGLANAADDTAAAAASVPVGGAYRNGSDLMVRVT